MIRSDYLNILELLEQEAVDQKLFIDRINFNSSRIKGLYCNGSIAISNNLETQIEETCVLAEELGHFYTTTGNIIDQAIAENRKQELKARLFAYQQLVTPEKLIKAKASGCRNAYEIAEYLEVTGSFLQSAIDAYRCIYGCAQQFGDYLFTFDPTFNIYKMNQ